MEEYVKITKKGAKAFTKAVKMVKTNAPIKEAYNPGLIQS